MKTIKESTYARLTKEITKRVNSTVYYSRGIDIIPSFIEMNLLSREDVAQEFLMAIMEKSIGEQGQVLVNALESLESALERQDTQSINRNIKFLMLYNSFTVINTVTRNHGIKKAEPITEPYINDREQLGLTQLFSEYSIDKANSTVQSAIYKRMEGITLTPTERKALSRFVKKFRKENQ